MKLHVCGFKKRKEKRNEDNLQFIFIENLNSLWNKEKMTICIRNGLIGTKNIFTKNKIYKLKLFQNQHNVILSLDSRLKVCGINHRKVILLNILGEKKIFSNKSPYK